MGARLGVVYLVWGPLGTAPLRAFLAAYRRFASGAAHELIVAFNGVPGEGEQGPAASTRAELLGELEGVEHRLVELERPVLDLAAYLELAHRLQHERLCFLNSHSEPLLDGWLALLAAPAGEPGVGAVGATGSWASQSSHVRYILGLGGPYAKVYDDRERAKRLFAAWTPAAGESVDASGDRAEDADGSEGAHSRPGAAGEPDEPPRRRPLKAALLIARGPSFPAAHLRSNAFLLDRRLLLSMKVGPLLDKDATYWLESGRRSITRQIQRRGLEVLVAGADGAAYGAGDWAASNTFWQGAQENLIVADNQTRAYERGDGELRRAFSAHAWGEQAAPLMPGDERAGDPAAAV
jgi:hypothetical protein